MKFFDDMQKNIGAMKFRLSDIFLMVNSAFDIIVPNFAG